MSETTYRITLKVLIDEVNENGEVINHNGNFTPLDDGVYEINLINKETAWSVFSFGEDTIYKFIENSILTDLDRPKNMGNIEIYQCANCDQYFDADMLVTFPQDDCDYCPICRKEFI